MTREKTTVFEDVAILLRPNDDVAIAKFDLPGGLVIRRGETTVRLNQDIPTGHKFALNRLDVGDPVRRYGHIIGFATEVIERGDHVHVHNLGTRNYDRLTDRHPVAWHVRSSIGKSERRSFLGYPRSSGRSGTRNYIAVVSMSNCSASTARKIAFHFTPEIMADYPNVDGVIALTHHSGCCNVLGSDRHRLLQRILAGMARNPNVGGYILVGLGCEVTRVDDLIGEFNLRDIDGISPPPGLVIQEIGGIRKTVEEGIGRIEAMLPRANSVERTRRPISELVVALQCGGSDSWSGVTANPVIGLVSDEIVRQGGTVVLSETPEIYGAEHLLASRAVSTEVADRLIEKVRWWEKHLAQYGLEMDNNPSPGNKEGGLTTIYEKSLGAIAKAGSTPLRAVYDHAETITEKGLVFMDGPGYDPVSITGEVAGGCNLVLFSTGRGSVAGYKPAPVIKVASNSVLFEHMSEDMDIDAGKVLHGTSLEEVSRELLEMVIRVASGEPSKSEIQGVGEDEFNVWDLSGVL